MKIRHKCGYEWKPRNDKVPVSCPYCKQYLKERGKDYEIIEGGEK